LSDLSNLDCEARAPVPPPLSGVSALIRAEAVIFVVTCFLVIGTLAGVAPFSAPYADEYQRGVCQATHGSWFGFTRWWYYNWAGRWAGIAFQAWLLHQIPFIRYYSLLLLGPAVLQAISFAALWRLLLGRVGPMRIGLLTLVTLSLLWNAMPYPAESLYWFLGSLENQASIALGVITVIGMIALSHATPAVRLCFLPVVCILALVVTGTHELAGLALLLVVTVGTFLAYRDRAPAREAWLVLLVVTSLGAAFVILAPGNGVRHMLTERNVARHRQMMAIDMRSRLRFFVHSLVERRNMLLAWLVDPRLLAATALFVLSPVSARVDSVVPVRPSAALRFLALVSWTLIMATYLCLPAWAIYGMIPGRTLGALYTVFLVGWIINVVVWTPARGALDDRVHDPRIDLLRFVSFVVLWFGMFENGNFRLALRELHNRSIGNFHREHLAWHQRIRDAQQHGELDVVVPAIKSPTQLLRAQVPSISDDPTHFSNIWTALYFGLGSIRVEKPEAVETPAESAVPSSN
jgi:hypothetical protein